VTPPNGDLGAVTKTMQLFCNAQTKITTLCCFVKNSHKCSSTTTVARYVSSNFYTLLQEGHIHLAGAIAGETNKFYGMAADADCLLPKVSDTLKTVESKSIVNTSLLSCSSG
jgi:hypothetical protein